MKNDKKLISFVFPVYNEAENLPELLKQLKALFDKEASYLWEAVFVEHGSIDASFEILNKVATKDNRIKVLRLSRNFGADGGVAAGMKYANGEALIIMMADLQEPFEIVPKFVKRWEEGNEIVYGVVKKRTASKARNFMSKLFYRIMNLLTGHIFPENASDFRLIDRKVYAAINSMPEQNKYLRGLVAWTGFKSAGVEFDRKARFAGESKADFKTVFKVASNGIFSFSYFPLRLVSITGIGLTFVSFLLGLFYLGLFIVHGRVAPGAATIILIMLFLFGVLFFILGIISEYLARMYEEVKGRPTHIVKETVNL